uniref:Uncharacterized protein n=1 Tax=Guillardia theta TaxID=55529 RepID=A0A7S4K1Z6_GUITH|mmetsp:Transcript_20422/g.68184  ORF Transcript_20422/g.68184 Transcript_20422/m.68184 type:complete len:102 (+) Transcript_20422:384-689(+)
MNKILDTTTTLTFVENLFHFVFKSLSCRKRIRSIDVKLEVGITVLMGAKPLEVEDAVFKMTKAICQFEMNSVVRNKGEDLEGTNETRTELGKAVGDGNIRR